MNSNPNQICNEHKEVIVAIEYNLESEQDFVQLCMICLTQKKHKGKVLILNEAIQLMEDIKQQFQQNQVIKVNNIKNIMNKLKDEISMISTKIKSTCDKLLENIQQIIQISQDALVKLEQKLKELKVLSPKELKKQLEILQQQFKYEDQRLILQNLIQQLSIDKQLYTCKNILKQEETDKQEEVKWIGEKFQKRQDKVFTKPRLNFICEEHQSKIICLDLSQETQRPNRQCCFHCQQNVKGKFVDLKNAFDQWIEYVKISQEVLKRVNSFYDNKYSQMLQIFDKVQSYLLEIKATFQEKFDQYLKDIGQKIQYHQQQNQIKNWEFLTKEEVILISSKLSHEYSNQQINQLYLNDFAQIDNEISNFMNNQFLISFCQFSTALIETISNSTNLINNSKNQSKSRIYLNKQNSDNEQNIQQIQCVISNVQDVSTQTLVEFDLIYSMEEQEECWSLLFSKDGTKLLTCHDSKKIKVYDFNQGNPKLIQVLEGNAKELFAIQFHNNSNQIISSNKNDIIIWDYDQKQKQWIQNQILQSHDKSINCLISNQDETILISGGDDSKINYWFKQQQNEIKWYLKGNIDNLSSAVLSLSLNEQQEMLLATEYNLKLSIYKLEKNDKWVKFQIVNLDFISWRTSFIQNDLFVVQKVNGIFSIFKYQSENSKFDCFKNLQLGQQTHCQYWFPIIYNKKKQLLLNKHHSFVYLIRQIDDNFSIEQSINFESENIWGTFSNDGQYIATWDNKSAKLQIRKIR